MKTSFKLFLIIMLFVSVGCDKENRLETKLAGSWELRNIKGGFLPVGTLTEYAPGNGKIIKFKGNSFQRFDSGKLIDSGTFSIVKEEANVNGDELSYKIVYQSDKNQTDYFFFFKISGNTLVLYIGHIAADGVEVTYEKQ